MSDKSVCVSLAVNDDNGNHTGLVDAVTFDMEGDMLMQLNGWPNMVCRVENNGKLRMGQRTFPIKAYSTWVGNMAWDAVRVDIPTANAIANYLQTKGFWDCIEAETSLYDAWKEKKPIDFSVFQVQL